MRVQGSGMQHSLCREGVWQVSFQAKAKGKYRHNGKAGSESRVRGGGEGSRVGSLKPACPVSQPCLKLGSSPEVQE